jgi:hypothetical protein
MLGDFLKIGLLLGAQCDFLKAGEVAQRNGHILGNFCATFLTK